MPFKEDCNPSGISDITKIKIIQGDITTLDTDAIVNATNQALVLDGGVCGAIYSAAGPELAQACKPLAPCPAGGACITPGFGLRARHVIHTVGPVWHGGDQGEAELLTACYRNAVLLAAKHHLQSIAFPAISTGIFGYPEDQAAKIAVSTLCELTCAHAAMPQIYLCCFSSSSHGIMQNAYHHCQKGTD